jgi:hypothetical protein
MVELDDALEDAGDERLDGHLRDQYRDREIYWSIRARARSERDVLSLIMDGMDHHSKFRIPQWSRR